MKQSLSLLTDFYELTMMQGYFLHKFNPPAVFEMFFRKHPFGSGYTVCAGLETLLRVLEDMNFTQEDIGYLDSTGTFRQEFLSFLEDLSFTGEIHSVPEGEVVFPGEPLLQVHAPLIEAQWVESLVLNIINFQTLIATKAARICSAADHAEVIDFGLRRSHGPDGGLSASRAAYIGGVSGTSNTLAGKEFGIPVKGTMAHSWVMAFADERDAFEKYSQVYPDRTILLIDTIDTLESGLPHAIETGLGLKQQGYTAFGVRLDSGDLGELSSLVREKLDAAGLKEAKIIASNDLDEYAIDELSAQAAPIDVYGVGTRLVTAYEEPALGGVYKLVAVEKEGEQVVPIKVSDDPEKHTLPGVKQVYRFLGRDEEPQFDLLSLAKEQITHSAGNSSFSRQGLPAAETCRPLLDQVMKKGRICIELPSLEDARTRRDKTITSLPFHYRRLENPQVYPLVFSHQVRGLKESLNP